MGDEGVFSPEDRENFKNAFDAFDDDRDDRVATDVLGKLLRAVGFNPLPEEVDDMRDDINAPVFDFNSFLYILWRHAREADPEGELIDSFKVFDKNGSGKLKVPVIRQILGNLKQPFTDDQISELIGQAEVDQNDEICYADFVRVMLDF
jgi:Ca2+-binding EF-hand superfamily protein